MKKELTVADVAKMIEERSKMNGQQQAELMIIDAQIAERKEIVNHPENASSVEELLKAKRELEDLELKKKFIQSHSVHFETPEKCNAVYMAMLRAKAESDAKFRSEMTEPTAKARQALNEYEIREKGIHATYEAYRNLYGNQTDFPILNTAYQADYTALKTYLNRVDQLSKNKH